MATNGNGYWTRAWALLTRDDGWIKPLLVVAAARLVPIVGAFGADGYALEWARLTSWGVDSAPKQRNVDISACIMTGARAFVVALGYGIVIAAVRGLVSFVLGDALGSIFAVLLGLVTGTLVLIAQVRSAIYQSIGSGYQLDRISDMIKRDTDGATRLIGLSLVINLVIGTIAGILVSVILLFSMGDMIVSIIGSDTYGYMSESEIASMVFGGLAKGLPALCVSAYLISIMTTFSGLINTTAVGLWMRQFDVQNWGDSADPLPGEAPGLPQGGYATTSVPPQQSTPGPMNYDIPQGREMPSNMSGGSMEQAGTSAPAAYDVPAANVEPQTFSLTGDEPIATPAPAPAPEPTYQPEPAYHSQDSANPDPFVLVPPVAPAPQVVEPQAEETADQSVSEFELVEPAPIDAPTVFEVPDMVEPAYEPAAAEEPQVMEVPMLAEEPATMEEPAIAEPSLDEPQAVDEVPTFSLSDFGDQSDDRITQVIDLGGASDEEQEGEAE